MPKTVEGIPESYLIGGAVAVGILYFYLRGRTSNPSNSVGGSSIVNASNSPLANVINTGTDIGGLVPNEPGTSPIRNINEGPQYT